MDVWVNNTSMGHASINVDVTVVADNKLGTNEILSVKY